VTRHTPTFLAPVPARVAFTGILAGVVGAPGRFAPGRGGVDTPSVGLWGLPCGASGRWAA